MTRQRHSIEKASLKLVFSSEKSAGRWQDEYLRAFRDEALPALEEVLDRFAQNGQTIRLGRLHIDLGDLPLDPSGRALAAKLQSQLARQLAALIPADAPSGNGVTILSAEASALEALEGFLLSGQWPTAMAADFEATAGKLWLESRDRFIAVFRRAYQKGGDAVAQRLAYQLEPGMLKELGSRLLGENADKAMELKQRIEALSPSVKRRVSSPFWITVMKTGLEAGENSEERSAAFFRAFIHQLVELGIKNDVLEKILPAAILQAHAVPEPPVLQTSRQPSPAEETAPTYGPNAGVILLHPFLAGYFGEFGLLKPESKEFTSRDAQMKAVYLLHFLATGQWLCPEPQLPIHKVICGFPVHGPISKQFEITPAERKESEKLLRAVLHHWQALGNASIDGLREGFLQREGKLQQQEGGWLLQMEKKTMDLLLEKIPWNISLVKLPWLKGLIRVEWA